jgi:protein-L-isoaspartate(D-aspartate) O-methyltransferase
MSVRDPVAAAVEAVPRAGFQPEDQRRSASYDGPLPIGYGQTRSQPRTVAAMLRLLRPVSGHRVLDVGAGSGWTTALLADLVGSAGTVIGVELEPALAAWGEANVRGTAYSWASVRVSEPGVLGWPAEAPYDRILVSAAATGLPEPLVDQLADGGRMVLPVAGTMTLVQRSGDDLAVSRHGAYRFVPLR